MAFSRMVAFDGGPASLTYVRTLRDIVGHHPNLLLHSELFAGTSGGALTAAFLARRIQPGLTAEGANRLMRELVEVNNEMLTLLAPSDAGYERLLLGRRPTSSSNSRLRSPRSRPSPTAGTQTRRRHPQTRAPVRAGRRCASARVPPGLPASEVAGY